LVEGQLLTMPGRLQNGDHAIVKLVSVVPGNAGRNLPTIQGLAMLFDAHTGEPVAQLEGAMLTAVRTAAVSAAAARRLSDGATETLALLGAGAQAPWQTRALCSVLPIGKVRIWAPTAAHRERLAAQLDAELQAEVRAVDEASEATRGAELICCATTAPSAFLQADMLTAGRVLVVAVGAFRPDMAEVGVSVFAQAERVFVDDVEAAFHEAGDVLAAIDAGELERGRVLPVGSVQSAPAEWLTIFKSVGSAVEDAAVASALWSQR